MQTHGEACRQACLLLVWSCFSLRGSVCASAPALGSLPCGSGMLTRGPIGVNSHPACTRTLPSGPCCLRMMLWETLWRRVRPSQGKQAGLRGAGPSPWGSGLLLWSRDGQLLTSPDHNSRPQVLTSPGHNSRPQVLTSPGQNSRPQVLTSPGHNFQLKSSLLPGCLV